MDSEAMAMTDLWLYDLRFIMKLYRQPWSVPVSTMQQCGIAVDWGWGLPTVSRNSYIQSGPPLCTDGVAIYIGNKLIWRAILFTWDKNYGYTMRMAPAVVDGFSFINNQISKYT